MRLIINRRIVELIQLMPQLNEVMILCLDKSNNIMKAWWKGAFKANVTYTAEDEMDQMKLNELPKIEVSRFKPYFSLRFLGDKIKWLSSMMTKTKDGLEQSCCFNLNLNPLWSTFKSMKVSSITAVWIVNR